MTDRLLTSRPDQLFRELLREACEEQRVTPSETAEAYLVRLLERFLRADGQALGRPLALSYLESFSEGRAERREKLRHVGDTALFLTGVFTEKVEDSLVGAEYYAALGELAYRQLAAGGVTDASRDVVPLFTELSCRFLDFVRVLSQMSLARMFEADRELMRVYRRWLVSRGARDADWLIRRGIIPFAPKTRSLQ